MLKIAFSPVTIPGQNALILTVADQAQLGEYGKKLDRQMNGALKRAMADNRFTGAKEQLLTVLAPAKSRLSRIVLVGIGEAAKVTDVTYQRAGGAAYGAVSSKDQQAVLVVDTLKGLALAASEAAANMAFGGTAGVISLR